MGDQNNKLIEVLKISQLDAIQAISEINEQIKFDVIQLNIEKNKWENKSISIDVLRNYIEYICNHQISPLLEELNTEILSKFDNVNDDITNIQSNYTRLSKDVNNLVISVKALQNTTSEQLETFRTQFNDSLARMQSVINTTETLFTNMINTIGELRNGLRNVNDSINDHETRISAIENINMYTPIIENIDDLETTNGNT